MQPAQHSGLAGMRPVFTRHLAAISSAPRWAKFLSAVAYAMLVDCGDALALEFTISGDTVSGKTLKHAHSVHR